MLNCKNQKYKPTILLGAGAALQIGAPKTEDITQEIIKEKKYKNSLAKNNYSQYPYFTAITKIYEHLKNKYPREPNFEQIFHVLEMFDAYNWVWSYECKNPNLYPLFAPFVVPISNIVSHDEWDNLASLIKQCQNDIMEKISKYNSNYAETKDFQWYKNFWNLFEKFDLFNLNYDTTIEQSIQSYCDGFVDSDDSRFKKFDPKELYTNKNNYKICHLHGCILYGPQKYKKNNHDVYDYNNNDMYKWTDFETLKKILSNSGSSNISNQSGETLYMESIITGLRKTDKITILPYNDYQHYLGTAIQKNKSLLIVGYSFSDLYINNVVDRMNLLYGKDKRIVIITYWTPFECEKSKSSTTKTFMDKEWDPQKVNRNEIIFIKKMMHVNSLDLYELDKTIQNEDSFTSKDGDVKLFVYGFKSAVEKHADEIINFLTNN